MPVLAEDVGEEVASVPDRLPLELVKGLPPEAAVELAPLVPVATLVEKIGKGGVPDDGTIPDDGAMPDNAVELAPLVPDTTPEAAKPEL